MAASFASQSWPPFLRNRANESRNHTKNHEVGIEFVFLRVVSLVRLSMAGVAGDQIDGMPQHGLDHFETFAYGFWRTR